MRYRLLAWLLVFLVTAAGAGCGGPGTGGQVELALAPESALPDFVRGAPPQVKEAYRFAIANPDRLTSFPCYCGCGAAGHQNNLQCYVKGARPDGALEFDNHAFG
jgi:hypothetical protein